MTNSRITDKSHVDRDDEACDALLLLLLSLLHLLLLPADLRLVTDSADLCDLLT